MRPHRAPSPLKASRALRGVTKPGRFDMPPKHPACGKRRAGSYEQALGYVLWLAKHSKDPLRIYGCPACAGWHVTKNPLRKDQA